MGPRDAIINRLQQFLTGALVDPDPDAANSALAAQFFAPAAPMEPIPIYTEERGTVRQKLTDALVKQGISVFMAHVESKAAENQTRSLSGGIRRGYTDIPIFCYVIENPKTNRTGVNWDEVCFMLEWWLPQCTPVAGDGDSVLKLAGSAIATPPQIDDSSLKTTLSLRSRLALFTTSAGFTQPIVRS